MSVEFDPSEEESDYDDALKVKLDDSEEERTATMDDGFEFIEIEKPKFDNNRVEVNGKSFRYKSCASKSLKKILTANKEKVVFVVPSKMAKRIKMGGS